MWKLTEAAKNLEPIPEVPWRDMDDDEFRDVSAAYNERMGYSPMARHLHASGFWTHDRNEHTKAAEGVNDGA